MSTEVPNTPGEEDARRQATASRAALLESWRERLFRDIRVYIYEMHHAMSAAMLAMCTAPIPLYLWWTRYPEFPRAQDIWLYLLVLCGCGAILGVCLELRSTTTSTKLTFNRMIGSLLMCVYAGGSNIALVAYLSRHNPPWEVIAFDLTALVSLVMVFTVPHLFMLMVLGYPFGFLGTSVGRIPGRFSSKAKGLSVEEIQKKIAGAGVTWHRQEYRAALAIHPGYSDHETLLRHEKISADTFEITMLRAFGEVPSSRLGETLREVIPEMSKARREQLLEIWAQQPDRGLWREAITSCSIVQVEPGTAQTLLRVQLEDRADGAQRAALSVLSGSSVSMHDEALDYMEQFARKEHAMGLYDVAQATRNPLLARRIEALLERLGERMGQAQGKLSLAQDMAGRLSTPEDD